MYNDDNNFQSRPPRQMFDVTDLGLTCSDCGTEIKELPFQPTKKDDGTFGKLFCRDCNRKRKSSFGGSGGGSRGGFGGGNRGGRY